MCVSCNYENHCICTWFRKSHSIYVREMQLVVLSLFMRAAKSHSIYVRELQPVFCCICSHACGVSFHICARVATKSAQVALNSIESLISHTRASCNNDCKLHSSTPASLISHTRASCNGRNCANFTAPLFSFLSHLLTHFVWNGALATYGARFLVRTPQHFYVYLRLAPSSYLRTLALPECYISV